MSKPAQKIIDQIFSAGTLQEKHTLIMTFLSAGHSLLYSGDVAWRLVIPAENKTHRGAADCMDTALYQIRLVIEDIIGTVGPAAKVALAMEPVKAFI